MSDADQRKIEHFPADTSEAYRAGQHLIRNGANQPGDIVEHREHHQGIDESVTAAEEPAKPASHNGEYHLDRIPDFLHDEFPFLKWKRAGFPTPLKLTAEWKNRSKAVFD